MDENIDNEEPAEFYEIQRNICPVCLTKMTSMAEKLNNRVASWTSDDQNAFRATALRKLGITSVGSSK